MGGPRQIEDEAILEATQLREIARAIDDFFRQRVPAFACARAAESLAQVAQPLGGY